MCLCCICFPVQAVCVCAARCRTAQCGTPRKGCHAHLYFGSPPRPTVLGVQGTLQDHTVLQDRLRRILGDLTFAEAYQRSGVPACAWRLASMARCHAIVLVNWRHCEACEQESPTSRVNPHSQCAGRILNVMVSAADTREPPRLLNYLTAPNVSGPRACGSCKQVGGY